MGSELNIKHLKSSRENEEKKNIRNITVKTIPELNDIGIKIERMLLSKQSNEKFLKDSFSPNDQVKKI